MFIYFLNQARDWFLEFAFVYNIGMQVCVCSQGHSHE